MNEALISLVCSRVSFELVLLIFLSLPFHCKQLRVLRLFFSLLHGYNFSSSSQFLNWKISLEGINWDIADGCCREHHTMDARANTLELPYKYSKTKNSEPDAWKSLPLWNSFQRKFISYWIKWDWSTFSWDNFSALVSSVFTFWRLASMVCTHAYIHRGSMKGQSDKKNPSSVNVQIHFETN